MSPAHSGSHVDDADGIFIGLISGTSADAIDAVALRFPHSQPQLLASMAVAYPTDLRADLLSLAQSSGDVQLDALGQLDARVAEQFADAALAVMQAAQLSATQVRAIGSHGQTVWHRPAARWPFTVQLGDPNRIAEATGCTVVADFRRRDMAAGGQGAPLMPAFHAAMLADADDHCAVLNLGGIANLTLISREQSQPVRGFDTGPASCLLDAWTSLHRGDSCDRDGAFAREGQIDTALLDALLDDAYFAQPAPKSTGREVFNLTWLRRQPGVDARRPQDVQATLLELSARSVAEALRREAPHTGRVLACGGGVHNGALMASLARHLAPATLASTAALGIDPDYVEAMGFAWLARETLAGRPGNLPSVTGARGARILGAIHPA